MDLFKHLGYTIVFVCTLGNKNLWKEAREEVPPDGLPDTIYRVEITKEPLSSTKDFVKEYDKLMEKYGGEVILYLCDKLPWQAAYYRYQKLETFEDKECLKTIVDLSGDDFLENLSNDPHFNVTSLISEKLYHILKAASHIRVSYDRDCTDAVYGKRSKFIAKEKRREEVEAAIDEGIMLEECSWCETKFRKYLPDKDGNCSLCGAPAGIILSAEASEKTEEEAEADGDVEDEDFEEVA